MAKRKPLTVVVNLTPLGWKYLHDRKLERAAEILRRNSSYGKQPSPVALDMVSAYPVRLNAPGGQS